LGRSEEKETKLSGGARQEKNYCVAKGRKTSEGTTCASGGIKGKENFRRPVRAVRGMGKTCIRGENAGWKINEIKA